MPTQEEVYEWFKAVKDGENERSYLIWNVDKESYFERFPKKWRYFDEHFKECFDNEQVPNRTYHSYVIIGPGNRAITPLRQFVEHHKLGDGTNETLFYHGSLRIETAPIDQDHTPVELQAPQIARNHPYGGLVAIPYDNIIDGGIQLIDAIENSFVYESISNENDQMAELMSNRKNFPSIWLDGEGNDITIKGDKNLKTILSIKSILAAKSRIREGGYDNSNFILLTDHKGLYALERDPMIWSYIGWSCSEINQAVLEKVLGIKIIVVSHLAQGTPTPRSGLIRWFYVFITRRELKSKSTASRSVLFAPLHSMGLVTKKRMVFEAQQRSEVQKIYVSGTHSLNGLIKYPELVACISHGKPKLKKKRWLF